MASDDSRARLAPSGAMLSVWPVEAPQSEAGAVRIGLARAGSWNGRRKSLAPNWPFPGPLAGRREIMPWWPPERLVTPKGQRTSGCG